MAQEKLFYEDEFEALQMMISGSDKSVKEVAGFLFPHLKPESAYARLKACLNPERDERLTLGQIIAAMVFCKRYDPLMFACDETLHARPDRKAPEDEEVRLVEVISEAGETLGKAMRQLELIQARRQAGVR
jgi:hypothetical protein